MSQAHRTIKSPVQDEEELEGFSLLYTKKGFIVKIIEIDGAFEGIKDELLKEPYSVGLHLCNSDELVETIERKITLFKSQI